MISAYEYHARTTGMLSLWCTVASALGVLTLDGAGPDRPVLGDFAFALFDVFVFVGSWVKDAMGY